MSKFSVSPLAILILLAIVPACSNSSGNRNETLRQNDINSPAVIPSSKSSPEKGKEEKSFSFAIQGGESITGYVYPDSEKPKGRMVIFAPFLDKTDGNLYRTCLQFTGKSFLLG